MYQDREEKKKNRQKRTRKNRKKWTTTPYTRLVVISTWTVFEMVNQNHARLSIYEHMRNKHKGNGFTTHLWSFDISFVCCFCCCFFCLFDIFFFFCFEIGRRVGIDFCICRIFYETTNKNATNHFEWVDQMCLLVIILQFSKWNTISVAPHFDFVVGPLIVLGGICHQWWWSTSSSSSSCDNNADNDAQKQQRQQQ